MSHNRKVTYTFAITGVLIILSFAAVFAKSLYDRSHGYAFTVTADKASSVVGLEMAMTQSWSKNGAIKPFGAEYDGQITNDGSAEIIDWTLTVDLGEEKCIIDSSWNGYYSIDGTLLIVESDPEVSVIPAGTSKTFGLVLYSLREITFDSFTLTGHYRNSLTTYPTFWVIITAALIWTILAIASALSITRVRRYEEMRNHDLAIISQTMETMAGMIDAKDPYTRGHSMRVADYSVKLARMLGFKKNELLDLQYIALMHDCGKIAIPDEVLKKPGRLSDDEYTIIKSHTTAGGRILENFTALNGIRDGALYHHERYDGKGYPEGIAGETIPYFARIICVADSFDAMNSDRCYRARLKRDVIIDEIERGLGTQFDPLVGKCMIELIKNGSVATEE